MVPPLKNSLARVAAPTYQTTASKFEPGRPVAQLLVVVCHPIGVAQKQCLCRFLFLTLLPIQRLQTPSGCLILIRLIYGESLQGASKQRSCSSHPRGCCLSDGRRQRFQRRQPVPRTGSHSSPSAQLPKREQAVQRTPETAEPAELSALPLLHQTAHVRVQVGQLAVGVIILQDSSGQLGKRTSPVSCSLVASWPTPPQSIRVTVRLSGSQNLRARSRAAEAPKKHRSDTTC